MKEPACKAQQLSLMNETNRTDSNFEHTLHYFKQGTSCTGGMVH